MKLLAVLILLSINAVGQQLKQLNPDLLPAIDLTQNGRDSVKKAATIYKVIQEKWEKKIKLTPDESAFLETIGGESAELDVFIEKGLYYYVGPGYGCCYYENGGPDSIWCSSSSSETLKADNISEESLDLAWAEGKEGSGVGEWIAFRMIENAWPMEKLIIYNGYQKDIGLWKRNNRVRHLKLYVDGKPAAILNLEDVTNGQEFDVSSWFKQREKPYFIKLEILSIYKGEKHDDTVISEIIFDGPSKH